MTFLAYHKLFSVLKKQGGAFIMHKEDRPPDLLKLNEKEIDEIKKRCHPILFSEDAFADIGEKEFDDTCELFANDNGVENEEGFRKMEMVNAAPFQTFSMEKSDGSRIYKLEDDGFVAKHGLPYKFSLDFYCYLADEVSPTKLRYFSLIHIPETDQWLVCTEFANEQLNFLVIMFHAKVRKNKSDNRTIAHFQIQETEVRKTGKRRIRTATKGVIYLGKQTSFPSSSIKLVGNSIDWLFSFKVRGHWRKLNNGKLGKNRMGEYGVTGFTWVSEHTRGDKNAPLIIKPRVVENE